MSANQMTPIRRFADAVRTGAYMDRDRAIVGAAIFGTVCVIGLVAVLVTSDGLKDWMGRPLGTDFIVLYAGGKVAVADGASAVYDVNRIFAEHQTVLGETAPDWGPFFYPPLFIVIAMALSSLPYAAAWLSWMAATGGLYVVATRKIADFRFSFVPILAFSAVFMNLMQGQTGFLIASLFAGGLAALFSGRALLAGCLLGLLAIKPQFGVLLPIALAAGGYWRAFGAAACSAGLTLLAPTLLFGPEVWTAFSHSAQIARIEVLEKGGIGYFKIISAFAQARMLGAPVIAAYVIQGVVAFAGAAAVFAIWRSSASNPLKGATLIFASLLASPYLVEYDLVVLAPAIAFLVAEARQTGFKDYEKTLLVLTFLAPGVTRMATVATSLSFGLAIIFALLTVTAMRVRGDRSLRIQEPQKFAT
jgi:hypothetical protein